MAVRGISGVYEAHTARSSSWSQGSGVPGPQARSSWTAPSVCLMASNSFLLKQRDFGTAANQLLTGTSIMDVADANEVQALILAVLK